MVDGKTVWHDLTFGEILGFNKTCKLQIINILINEMLDDAHEEAKASIETEYEVRNNYMIKKED